MDIVVRIGWILLWAAVAIMFTALLYGCEAGVTQPPAPGWTRYQLPPGTALYVIPHELADGTQCAIAVTSSSNAGAGITCDWSRP